LTIVLLFQNLENGASADVNIREKIAKLPPEVSEIRQIDTLGKLSLFTSTCDNA